MNYDKGKDESSFSEIFVEDLDVDSGWKGKPFDPNLIDIVNQSQAVSNVIDQIEADEIDLAPAFQRAGNLWNATKQSRLIESMLLRIPLPAFYFDVEESVDELGVRQNKWHVIDGLQRLCSIKNFCANLPDNSHKLYLTDMEFLAGLNGLSYEQLPRPYQRIIRETQLTVYLVKPNTPVNVKFNIFKRVNTGGVPLTPQEIRHALNQGVAADFVAELAASRQFVEATGGRVKSLRMLDREFVNRFLAFYLIRRAEDEDMDAYFCRALLEIARMSPVRLTQIKESFYDALDVLSTLFGKWAFCKLDKYPKTKPINKVLFEVMTVSVARLNKDDRAVLRESKNALKKYVRLLAEGSELTDLVTTTTGAQSRVDRRYAVVEEFLQSLMR